MFERILSLVNLVQAKRPSNLQSSLIAALYAAQACLSVVLILSTYQFFHVANPLWAIVSAVLILQPGLNQSLATSLTRVVANLMGVAMGSFVQFVHGHGALGLCEALVLVVVICELLRLDQGLRTACSSAMIVMLPGGSVFGLGTERVFAVIIGCALAMAVQLLTEALKKLQERYRSRRVVSAGVS